MGQVLTLLFVMAALFIIVNKLLQANRDAGLREEEDKKEAARDKRRAMEKDILERLERIREKQSELELAKDAIQRDPKRAAKVVSNMLKDREPAKQGKGARKR